MSKGKITLYVLLALLIMGAFSVIGFVCEWTGQAVQVVKEEVNPRALQDKYEWFKDVAAQLDAKYANIQVYKARFTMLDSTPRSEWDRADKEQYSLWQQELAGVTASFNGLCAEYNAQMAKWNWQFCEIGTLPKGATQVLPREFKPYQYN